MWCFTNLYPIYNCTLISHNTKYRMFHTDLHVHKSLPYTIMFCLTIFYSMRRILRCFTGLCFLGLLSLLCIFFRTDLRQKYVQPSIEALFLHNTDLFVEEYSIVSPKYSCPSNASENDVEDVLCMVCVYNPG